MDQVARFNPQDRSDLFRAAAEKRGLTAGIIEKDFWVCWVLRRIYLLSDLPAQIHFKGGTSLSKVFRVIDRMSEDIDLVIDRIGLGFTGDKDPTSPGLSNKRRKQLIEQIRASACDHVNVVLKPAFEDAFSKALAVAPSSTTWNCSLENSPDGQSILFQYPTIEPSSRYIRAVVRLELGARGDPWPSVKGTIRPYAADEFPDQIRDPNTEIPFVVSAQRTFWEKATILHMHYHKSKDGRLGPRQARHYYDLFRLSRHELGRSALNDLGLLAKVVEHKMLFFPGASSNYDSAKPGSLKLVPPEPLVDELRNDYNQMAEEMMFGEVPGFDEVIDGLQEIESLLNQVSARKKPI